MSKELIACERCGAKYDAEYLGPFLSEIRTCDVCVHRDELQDAADAWVVLREATIPRVAGIIRRLDTIDAQVQDIRSSLRTLLEKARAKQS
jgi:hypothetical protein